MKRKSRTLDRPLKKLALGLIFALLFWGLGGLYQEWQYKKDIKELKNYTVETYYFIDPQIVDPYINATKELYVEGELGWGRCLNQEGMDKLK